MRRTALVLVAAVVMAACSNGDSTQDVPSETTPEATESSDAPSEGATVAVDDGDEDPVRGGHLQFAVSTYPESLHPVAMTSSYARTIATGIYDTLLTIDSSGALQPRLATDWSTPDGGATWTIELRDDVMFQDGETLDADAVVAHVEFLVDPDNECPCLGAVAALENVEATGPLEVTFQFSEPNASFPSLIADTFGMIVSPNATPEDPIGAGPFKLSEQVQDESVTVTAWDGYWQDGKPYLGAITYRAIPDIDTRIAAIQAGDLHVSRKALYPRWDEIRAAADLQLIEYGGLGSHMILFNTAAAPFDDIRARIAVAKAIDLETLHETVNSGAVQPATSIFSRDSWAYPGEIDNYPSYDPDGAADLVAELGGLSFTMTVPSVFGDLAVPVQAMLAQAGIDAQIDQQEVSTAIAAYRSGNYQSALTSYSGRIDPQTFASAYATGSVLNFTGISDEDLDRLVAEAGSTMDQGERAAIYADLAVRAAEVLPFAILNNHNDAYVASRNVRDLIPTPDGLFRYPEGTWLAE